VAVFHGQLPWLLHPLHPSDPFQTLRFLNSAPRLETPSVAQW